MNIQHNHLGLLAYPIINKVLLDIYVNKYILGFAGFLVHQQYWQQLQMLHVRLTKEWASK